MEELNPLSHDNRRDHQNCNQPLTNIFHQTHYFSFARTQVRRTAGINLEARQRCKVLTHPLQVELRKERAELIQQEINCKFNEKIDGLKMRIKECKLIRACL